MKLPKVLIFSFYVLLLILFGCSTTNHGVLPKQAYQDLTSHYNAYFNSSEKLKNVFKLAESYHKDKFDSVLPVYYYTDQKEFASYASDLDDVIKRSTLAVQLHTTANWTDDHFLLIGEAHFLKGDYDKASNSFKYITTEFKNGVDYVKVMKSLGKKPGKYVHVKKVVVKPKVNTVINKDGTTSLEKVDNRPEESLWIHTPARSEALVWLIKTYTRQKKYDQASSVVTYTRSDDLFYKDYDADLNLAEADLRVAQKNYQQAIAPLESYLVAKKVHHSKHLSVRPLFVLAQCYQALGNNAKAIENYKKVLKSRPNYDMEFYAKIKMAKLARGASNNNAEIRALLAKMARDQKYKDYWDQVYYELALISLSENNRVEARKFLHKSVSNSTTNDDQKASSFLKLAELDYEDEVYVSSKFFYDSTIRFMPKNDARYRDIEDRDKVLSSLVKQLNIIYEEDSLQKLAGLPKDQIDKIIAATLERKRREEEEKKAAQEAAKQQQSLFGNTNQNNPNNQQNPNAGPSWYFYNTTARATGYNDFIRKWGRRNLEENWRRKNKSSATTEDENGTAVDTATAKKDSIEKPKGTPEEQMYANIPTTAEKMTKSADRLVDAYYTAGTIYKDGLESYPKAQEMFETLNARYPKNKLLLESYYNLYLIALKRKQNDLVEKYKGLILSEFPESVIAKVLRDPNYINEAKKKDHAVDEYFQEAYNDYANGRLDSAWYKTQMSNVIFKPNPLSAKFQLLDALILSKENRLLDYVQALNKIVNTSSDAAVKKTAADLLSLLNKSALPQVDLSKDTSRRDSLNAIYGRHEATIITVNTGKPDSAEMTEVQKLEAARQTAIKKGLYKNTDTVQKQAGTVKDTAAIQQGGATSIEDALKAAEQQEDTTSPYKRSDQEVHYFIIYIKDPAVTQGAIMSTMAMVDAFNSLQYSGRKLQSKPVTINKDNRVLTVRQFKNKEDVLAYYNSIKTQGQLFTGLKPGQFAITAISTSNFSTLISEKDVDLYINKFFNRVYK
ncbi:MAG: Tetratricopeptide domain protein [Bacteroidota bacterium]|nr:Tetratricopeptide domain protein [Bacteroidota bacterium]